MPEHGSDRPTGPPDPDDPADADDLDGLDTSLSRLKRHGRWVAAVVAVAMLVPAGAWLADELRFRTAGGSVTEVLSEDVPAVVADALRLVRTVGCDGQRRSGSAFAVDTGSRVALVTNRHVVEDAQHVTVRSLDQTDATTVTGVDISETADVAVLELADPHQLPAPLTLNRGRVVEGMVVRLVGFPAAMPFTAEGTVAEAEPGRLLLDLPADRGASGSPVLDEGGRVVAQLHAVTERGRGIATPVDRLLASIADARPIGAC